jgi:glycosyltransferase involved in cell wall biosynthesis
VPEVSVVIPAYNAEQTLAETLKSLLAQTFADFEAIVVDDGSKDGTATVARSFSDHRVRVVAIPNGGVATARNRGISEARSPIVAFLDADDLWLPGKLERQFAALNEHPDAAISVTAATRIDQASRAVGHMNVDDGAEDQCLALLLGSMVLGCVSSGVARKQILDSVGGFDPRFSQCADWDLWLRLSVAGPFAVIDEPLVGYRSTGGNMSSDISLLEHDSFAVLDAFFGRPEAAQYAHLRARIYSNHWMICAGSYLHAGQPRSAGRCLAMGLRQYPGNVSRALGLPSRRVGRLFHRGSER